MQHRIDLCEEYYTIQDLNADIMIDNIEFEKGQVYSVIGRRGMGNYIIDCLRLLNGRKKSSDVIKYCENKKIPIIVFSHISRRADCRSDKIPRPSDTTKTMCGDLRNVSKKIIALYRECYYCKSEDKSIHFYIYER